MGKKKKKDRNQNRYEAFSQAAHRAAVRESGRDLIITSPSSPNDIFLSFEARTRLRSEEEQARARKLAEEIGSIATMGGKNRGNGLDKKPHQKGQTRLPGGFAPPPSGMAGNISSPSSDISPLRNPGLEAIRAYKAAEPIADRIRKLAHSTNPKLERDEIIALLEIDPNVAVRAGHLLGLKPNVTAAEVESRVQVSYVEAIRNIKWAAIDAYRCPSDYGDSPEEFSQLLQRAVLIHGHHIFEPSESTFQSNARKKFFEMVERKTRIELHVKRNHASDIFRGAVGETLNSFQGAVALSQAGYYPFEAWKPGFHAQSADAAELEKVRELEAANRVPRWLLLVDVLENPPKKDLSFDHYLWRRPQHQIKGVSQPTLLAMAHEAAGETTMDKLDLAATRLGLSPFEWSRLKQNYLGELSHAPGRGQTTMFAVPVHTPR